MAPSIKDLRIRTHLYAIGMHDLPDEVKAEVDYLAEVGVDELDDEQLIRRLHRLLGRLEEPLKADGTWADSARRAARAIQDALDSVS